MGKSTAGAQGNCSHEWMRNGQYRPEHDVTRPSSATKFLFHGLFRICGDVPSMTLNCSRLWWTQRLQRFRTLFKPSGPVCAGQGSASGLADTTGCQRETLLHCFRLRHKPTPTAGSSDNDTTYMLPDGIIITVGATRFRCAEVLFQQSVDQLTIFGPTCSFRRNVVRAGGPLPSSPLSCSMGGSGSGVRGHVILASWH